MKKKIKLKYFAMLITSLIITNNNYAIEITNDNQNLTSNINCNPNKSGNTAAATDNLSWNGMPGPGAMMPPNPNMMMNNNQNMSAGNNYSWQPPTPEAMDGQIQPNENGVTVTPQMGNGSDLNIRITAQGNKMPNNLPMAPWMMGSSPGNWRNQNISNTNNSVNENNNSNIGMGMGSSSPSVGFASMGMMPPWGGWGNQGNGVNDQNNTENDNNANNSMNSMGMNNSPPVNMGAPPWGMHGGIMSPPGVMANNGVIENRLNNIEKRLDALIKQIENLSINNKQN